MRRCFTLASRGIGFVAPNPLVGAVVVHNNKIIGEGFHQTYGGHHAEVNAIASVSDHSLLKESTIYVNLEPCAHHGKTPPCADLIIDSGIPRVVVANRDPFVDVDGKGLEKLHAKRVDVTTGILEQEGRHLNRAFFTFHEKKRPYFLLKWAQTKDGFFDTLRSSDETGSNWISSPKTRKLVHTWRAQHQAILVGAQTVLRDDPELTVRDASGRQPARILLDPDQLVTPPKRILNDAAQTLVWSPKLTLETENVTRFNPETDLIDQVLAELHQRNIQSVLIEGGAFTLNAFISRGLWDEARIITGQKTFRQGLPAPTITGKLHHHFTYGGDHIEIRMNA